MKTKDLVQRVIGDGNVGRLEFFLHPEKQDGCGGPFNGQKFRQRIFFDLSIFLATPSVSSADTFPARGKAGASGCG